MSALDTRVPPPIVALISATGMWLLALALPGLTLPVAVPIALAIAIAAAGFALDVAGLVSFRSARTTLNPLRPDGATSLVTTGLYARSRNPMYVGLLIVLLAWTLYLANVAAIAGPVAFVLYMNRFQIGPEERVLAAKFGKQFTDYQSRVRRWL